MDIERESMGGKLFRIEGIGEILFERSPKAKRISISVRPFNVVRVAVPFGVSFKNARDFVRIKKSWIQKHLIKMRQIERDHQLVFQKFNDIDRHEARQILVQRLDELAKKYSFKYNRVFIKNQKTRWGSCSAKNNISLNIKLVRLPGQLMDYLILHELVHTRIKNHSKTFYAELERLVRNRKSLDKDLKHYSAGLL